MIQIDMFLVIFKHCDTIQKMNKVQFLTFSKHFILGRETVTFRILWATSYNIRKLMRQNSFFLL